MGKKWDKTKKFFRWLFIESIKGTAQDYATRKSAEDGVTVANRKFTVRFTRKF